MSKRKNTDSKEPKAKKAKTEELPSKKGTLLTCGCNDQGQLGRQTEEGEDEFEFEPVLGFENRSFRHILSKGQHNIVVVADGNNSKVFSWGNNDDFVLGRFTKRKDDDDQAINIDVFEGEEMGEEETPTEIPSLEDENVVSVTSGSYHSSALTKDGRLFVWGNFKDDNMMGIRSDRKTTMHTRKPELYPLVPGKIVKAASGSNFMVVQNDKNELFEFGVTRRTLAERERRDMRSALAPRRIIIKNAAKKIVITDIVCGAQHIMLLADDGSLYSAGHNHHGQLGLKAFPATGDQLFPPHEAFQKIVIEPVEQLACGEFFNVALLKNGEVFSWGDNRSGQLGLAKKDIIKVGLPTKVERFQKITDAKPKKIFCGSDHTVVLMDNGVIYTFGQNQSLQLGLEDMEDIFAPKKRDVQGKTVIDVTAGSAHTMLLVNDKKADKKSEKKTEEKPEKKSEKEDKKADKEADKEDDKKAEKKPEKADKKSEKEDKEEKSEKDDKKKEAKKEEKEEKKDGKKKVEKE